jgi:hypothetical protein
METLQAMKRYFAGGHRMRILLAILIVLVVADGLISRFLVINRFGVEANPFLASWISEDKFIYIKSLGALLAALLLWDIHKQNAKLARISTVFFVVAYSLIVFWNLLVFFMVHI